MIPIPAEKSRIVRVLTYGKNLETIEQETVASIQNGNQVLVNAACASDNLHPKPDGDKVAVAQWAEALSHQNGLGWRRVGMDVLFRKASI